MPRRPDRSEAFKRFQASTQIDYGKWRDGEPYDVDAIDAMNDAEKAIVEEELAAKGSLDWRDVEALQRIGTVSARARIRDAQDIQMDGGGAAALQVQVEDGWDDGVERVFIAKLEAARLMESSLDRLFEIAEQHPTPAVRAALFMLATEGDASVRYAFAAFLLYLNGHADDWYGLSDTHRPHMLDLQDSGATHAAAAAWLKAMIDKPRMRRPSES
jgi:hypothetical protein